MQLHITFEDASSNHVELRIILTYTVSFLSIYVLTTPFHQRQWRGEGGSTWQIHIFSVAVCNAWAVESSGYSNEVYSVFFNIPDFLLLKLAEIHVDPYIIQWIRSYLTNRTQMVVVGSEQSSVLPVILGVPQGSVLGPLLYNVTM